MKIILISTFLLVNFISCAQLKNTNDKTKPKGDNIVRYQRLGTLRAGKQEGKISVTGGLKGENTTFKFETFEQPKFIYNLATALPLDLQNDFEEGTVFLLSFTAKTETSSLETGEAKVLCMLNQSYSYKDNIESTISLASEWADYHIPFQATKDISKNDLKLVLQYGFRPQSFLIKNIKFEVFPMGTEIKDLPRTKITYAGMEKDAQWRKEAFDRIEKIRKGDFTLIFTKDGTPISNKKVKIELEKHQFSFGAALSAQDIVENNLEYKKFKQIFNITVLENDLKIKRWKNKKRKDITLRALNILKRDKINVKGHVLVWPGFSYLPKQIKKIKDDSKKVTNYINNHVKNILRETKGLVSQWDVVNEAYTNKDLQNITGSEKILYNTFRIAKRIQPQAKRYTNEYGIISKGGIDTQKQQWYYDFIKRIDKQTGGLVDGVGIQCHIGSDLTSPQKVLDILDFYSTLEKELAISEFTMSIESPEIKEQYTRDFMIAAFSHPKVSEFIFWGCMYNDRNKVDIFNEDGSLGTMRKAYFDLVHKKWKTVLSEKTNRNGKISARGFYGKYKYTVKIDGKEINGSFDFNNKNDDLINIEL